MNVITTQYLRGFGHNSKKISHEYHTPKIKWLNHAPLKTAPDRNRTCFLGFLAFCVVTEFDTPTPLKPSVYALFALALSNINITPS